MGFLDTIGKVGKEFATNTIDTMSEMNEGYNDAYMDYLDYDDESLKREFLKVKRDIRTPIKKGRALACKKVLEERGLIKTNR